MSLSRRHFLQYSSAALAGMAVTSLPSLARAEKSAEKIKISLAEWSLHKSIFAKKIDHLDFAKTAKQEFGITGVEYVNQFFKDKASDEAYLTEMKKRAEGEGVTSLLIMIDREGQLGDANEQQRKQAVENHRKWVEAAKFLGCHSIRVNAGSSGTYEEQLQRAADGLRQLTELAEPYEINVIVENHGGLSSNGTWLASVMKTVNHPRCGTLPDFGNFGIDRNKGEWYDRYQGVKELLPFAKAVSVKTYDFDDARPFVTIDTRWEKETDMLKMMQLVLDSGYTGFAGIEYEGNKLDEFAGIHRSKQQLEQVLAKLS